MALRGLLVWVDAQGERRAHAIVSAMGCSGICGALVAHSNAVEESISEGTLVVPGHLPTVATYPSVRTNVRLGFVAASGSRANLYLPAPQNNIFLPDGTTVDPSLIADIISAATGNLLAGDGTAVTLFTGGELHAGAINLIASLQVFSP